jgi:chromatin modification-related protein VID21
VRVTEPGTHAGKGQTSTVSTQTGVVQLEPVSAGGFPPKPPVPEAEAPSAKPISIQPPGSENVPHVAAPGTPVSAQEQVAPESSLSPGQLRRSPKDPVRDVSASGRAAVPTLQPPEVPAAQRKQDQLPLLAVGAVAQPDQPLSPASSVEPYSNNTPIPPTASPDTSPGEEVVDAEDQIVRPSKHVDQTPAVEPETSVQKTRPTLVPTTPDEQLKLEEALSLQQNQQDILAASKTIGDRSQPGGNPLSNEVIKENVMSPTTLATPSVDQMDVSKDLSPLSLEKTTNATKPSTTTSTTGPSVSESVQTSAVIVQQAPAVAAVSSVNKKPSPATMAPVAQPPPERMTTRVSSGAIRHKSVSEILGETPKPSVTQVDKAFAESTRANSLNEFLLSEKRSPDAAARIKQRKERERERTKLSTVVFPKQQVERNESLDLVRQNMGDLTAGLNDEQDYLFTLFQNKAYSPPRSLNLSTLLASAHKTLSTSNHLLDYQEQMDCRSLRRIYSLQNANRWPLRQLKRSLEPSRQWTHWDVLLDHMKWMRTDFREERKWKIAAAKSCADWCAEYVNSDAEQRAQLRVVARVPSLKLKAMPTQEADMVSPSQDDSMDEMVPVSHPTPDLIPSAEEDSLSEGFADEPRPDLHDTIAPAAIFSLGSDEFTFSMDMTPAAEKLLDELPIYTPVKMSPDQKMPMFRFQADADWKTEILPVSKYAVGRIRFRDDQPVRKRSRYDYGQYQGEMETDKIDVSPEQMNVALFRPENKHIRDRIHPGHSFRPPTEHPMPSVGFFESRQSSQWTIAEDDELRRLVKEYSYNWSLISSCLSSPSLFSSGAERRTPWECFERWIGLEGLPADMSKTQYFRAYHQRLETAQRTVLAQQQAAQQQQQQQQGQSGNGAQPQAPVRRRTTQPIRVDRRRASRHLALLDAMRKLAKKRETMLQKQQQGISHRSQVEFSETNIFLIATHLASLRKVNEANQPKPPISSPADFSKLKHEREVKLQERQEQYRQQMIAQQRVGVQVLVVKNDLLTGFPRRPIWLLNVPDKCRTSKP